MTDAGRTRKTVYDPLRELMTYFAGSKAEEHKKEAAPATVEERLKRHIIDGDRTGLQADLDEALKRYAPLEIINAILLDGMKTVGELFGSGQMQLPFVLQSAEVMKASVAYLEPLMEKEQGSSRGTMVIATVKGDVHDIGKNLVDIILTNNGYRVVNLGIKCPVERMLQAAQEHHAHAIGMSGLLVKSTLVMKENLEVMNEQGVTLPVVLGGAALTRRYVENDLRRIYRGKVFYATDAFEGLSFMERLAKGALVYSVSSSPQEEEDQQVGTEAKIALAQKEDSRYQDAAPAVRSRVSTSVPIPSPPFWGTRVVDNISLDDVYKYTNEAALIRGQWKVRKGKMSQEEYQKLLDEKILPDLHALQEQAKRERLLEPRVVYGYFPCQSDGNDLLVYADDQRTVLERFTFPRQQSDRFLCLADYFAPVGSGRIDTVAFQLVTMGRAASEHSARLFAANSYKEYLYFHGFSVESAEALAEFWHRQVRMELGIAAKDAKEIKRLFAQGYQGARYSFGYPACPNLEDQVPLMRLLNGERIGVRLTEGYQLDPEQSTSAIVVHHPEARYFNV